MQIRQLSSLSSTNSMIHVLFVWSLQCAFYAAAIMRVQWRCKNRRQSYLESLQESVHRLSSALSSEPQKWKSVLWFWHLNGIENASTAKGIFGILNLAKIRCGIRENARYLNRERDITATREARFATGCEIFLPVYREFGKSYLLRANASQPSA